MSKTNGTNILVIQYILQFKSSFNKKCLTLYWEIIGFIYIYHKNLNKITTGMFFIQTVLYAYTFLKVWCNLIKNNFSLNGNF